MVDDPFAPFLRRQRCVFLDGGLATELERNGAKLSGGLWSARLLAEAPERIRAVHDAYLEAGADCLIAASYQATVEGFGRLGYTAAEAEALLVLAVDVACQARDAFWRDPGNRVGRCRPLVAASVGPYGAYRADGSEYTGAYDLDQAGLAAFHRRRFGLLAGAGADLLAIETVPSVDEARAVVDVLEGLVDRGPTPQAWMSFTCRDETHLSDGTPLGSVVREVAGCRSIVALGVNCVPPRLVPGLIDTLRKVSDRPVIVYPNSGERWDAETGTWFGDSDPIDFADAGVGWVEAGAVAVGGCCRTGPDHIRRLRARLT